MAELHAISGTDTETRIADVIFVHGLGGDAYKTWRHGEDQSTSWPHWLGDEYKNVGVWSLGYAASPFKLPGIFSLFSSKRSDAGHSMAIPNRSGQVLNLLRQKGMGQRPIIFVCHSLGGILVKHILRDASDSLQERSKQIVTETRAVLFLSTPHAGATLASLLSNFRTILGTTVTLDELKAHDAHLSNLYDWYRNHAPKYKIETASYYETRDVKGMRIVNQTSAHPGVGNNPIATDDDHISIAKPTTRSAAVCETLREIIGQVGTHFNKEAQLHLKFAVLVLGKLNMSAGPGDLATPATQVLPTGASLANLVRNLVPSLSDVPEEHLNNLHVRSLRQRLYLTPGISLKEQKIRSEDVLIFTDTDKASLVDTYAQHMGWEKFVTNIGN